MSRYPVTPDDSHPLTLNIKCPASEGGACEGANVETRR